MGKVHWWCLLGGRTMCGMTPPRTSYLETTTIQWRVTCKRCLESLEVLARYDGFRSKKDSSETGTSQCFKKEGGLRK